MEHSEACRQSRSGSTGRPSEGNHQRRHQDVRRENGRTGWLSVIVKVQAWMLQAISEWESGVEQKRCGTVRRYDRPNDPESVELERGGTVRGFDRPFVVADSDAHIVGYLGAIHVKRTGGTAMSSSRHTSAMERTSESCWRSEQVELGGQLTIVSHKDRKNVRLGHSLGGNP